ncbi:hypothetical protein K443DRAFT_661744 [Laccaria amethystina LaAM-08-1]|uniref:DUF6534 domain-containing protein n=1 Tax=Laccaria amethystina LaAM-08-1 TaxID=1095629 RepID=A0A0C9XJB6_9AGAR|nr:hypothetical protein K443DRAFT_661744 [Laccaria amethystina LaAM-08-1]
MPSSNSSLIALILPLLSSLLMGYLFTWGLQGILVVQVYNYYMSFPNDRWHWKCIIYFLFVVELVQTILATKDAYTVYAEGFGQYEALDKLHLLWLTLPVMSGLVGFFCHSIFAYRIYILSELWQVGMFIFMLAAFALASAITFSAKLLRAGTLSKLVYVDHIYLFCGLWNGSAALCDIAIAGCMTFFLLRSPRFKNTHFLITKIIRLTIETGIFTGASMSFVFVKSCSPCLTPKKIYSHRIHLQRRLVCWISQPLFSQHLLRHPRYLACKTILNNNRCHIQ